MEIKLLTIKLLKLNKMERKNSMELAVREFRPFIEKYKEMNQYWQAKEY